MGNLFSTDFISNHRIRFIKTQIDTKYFNEIEVHSFNIEEIKNKLNSIKISDQDFQNVIIVLEHIQKTENPDIISQIDGYLFEKFNYLPFLAIKITSAQQYRRDNNISNDGFYYSCNLTKTYYDEKFYN